jgi:hypothetical protein
MAGGVGRQSGRWDGRRRRALLHGLPLKLSRIRLFGGHRRRVHVHACTPIVLARAFRPCIVFLKKKNKAWDRLAVAEECIMLMCSVLCTTKCSPRFAVSELDVHSL